MRFIVAKTQRKKNCERTFEQVLGEVEFRSIQNPDPKADEPISFLVLLKQTIETIHVALNFGDGTPPLDGIQLDRSTPIPDCSSGCKYVDWLRAVVTHFYTDLRDFEAVLTVTDSNRGAVPFVSRKTAVKVSQRFEAVSLMSSDVETDETSFHLPGFNPVMQKALSCSRFEIRILYEDDSGSEDATVTADTRTKRLIETLKLNEPTDLLVMKGRNETLAFEGNNEIMEFKGHNETLAFEGNNDSMAFLGHNETVASGGNNDPMAFNAHNETLTFEELSETTAVRGMTGTPTVERWSDSLPLDRWNGSLTFESARNITFRAVIESYCAPSVSRYVISWSLNRLANDGSYQHDDASQKFVSSTSRFNIPPRSLSKGAFEVQLEVS